MSERWFVWRQIDPGRYMVAFGPVGMSAERVHGAVAGIPQYGSGDMWRNNYEVRPLKTKSAPKKQGWRRSHSRHIGGGVRVLFAQAEPIPSGVVPTGVALIGVEA